MGTTAFTMVFPQALRHDSGLDGSIDSHGRRAVALPLAVLADDHPSAVRSLDNLGVVDLSHLLDSYSQRLTGGRT